MRRATIKLLVLGLLLVPSTASAQDDASEIITSFEPLQAVVDAYADGDAVSGFRQHNDAAGSPLISSLQLAVNLGWNPEFIDTEASPFGLASESGSELVSLNDRFDESLTLLPPLHPWGTDQNVTNIADLFPNWSAFGESGAVDGPLLIADHLTIVWGVELATPFDTSCAANRAVGRAFTREGITSPDGPLTAELLQQLHGDDSRSALANGEHTRYVELTCSGGDEPFVAAYRMNAERGSIRPFGPSDIVALVKDAYVVFFIAERILGVAETDIEPFFYANQPGGPVEAFEPISDVPALVPNVYDRFPDHLEIIMDLPEEEEAKGADDYQAIPLLLGPNSHRGLRVSTGCPPPVGTHFFMAFMAGANQGGMWSRTASTLMRRVGNDLWVIDGTTPDGRDFNLTISSETGDVTVETDECEGTGTATINGQPLGETAAEPETPAEEPEDTDTTPEPLPSDSGVPWGPIGIAVVLVGGLAYGVLRSRTRARDCRPEEEAWEAAIAAYEETKRTRDYWQGERDYWYDLHSEFQSQSTELLPEPNRELGYPDTPEGQAAYESDLADWQARRAQAGDEMGAFYQEQYQDATSNLDEAQNALTVAADLVWHAQIALQNCRGSAPALPEDMDPPTDPGSTPPPPPSSAQTPQCSPDGATEVRPEQVLPVETFTVLNGNIVLRGSRMASWNRAMGGGDGMSAEALLALSDGDIEDALADFGTDAGRNVVDPAIPTRTVLVRCGRVWKCQGGQWVRTPQTERMPDRELAQDTEKISTGRRSASQAQIRANIAQAQRRVEVLLANQERLEGFGCE